jgi:hypothetical protein
MIATIHNPDQYMGDLRQILAQGRKRLALLIGAGAPAAIHFDRNTGRLDATAPPLIPVTSGLTHQVTSALDSGFGEAIRGIVSSLGNKPNIEQILSRVRSLSEAIGTATVHGLDGKQHAALANAICDQIGAVVNVRLPDEATPYSELAGWVGGTARDHAFEIFTPNYDVLMEQAFERARIPYFDGFCGAVEPFFDPAAIANEDMPARWARLWKLHGSLGWDQNARGEIIRGPNPAATTLIYPTHLKYDQTQKLPYSALFERLRKFLQMPDSLLLTCGFSFSDAHLVAVMDDSLAANRAAAIMAFQHGTLEAEDGAVRLASRRANMSVYGRDAAVINCIPAVWRPGDLPHPAWAPIRSSYWSDESDPRKSYFRLGDFSSFARYIALTRADHAPPEHSTSGNEVK